MNDIEIAEVPLNYARMNVRDLVQQAYDAGKSTRNDDPAKPSADEVNKAIQAIEHGAVLLAHARMEYVAKACGFEGLTEALGYLQTLRANPIAGMLREVVGLCALGDVDEHTDALGWGDLIRRIKSVVGDKPPPAELPPYDPPPQVLSGCAVRATIQREAVNGSQTGDAAADIAERDERMAELYGTPDLDNLSTQQEVCVAEIAAVIEPKNRHGQTCAQTCGDMAAGGFHSALCHTVEAIMRGTPTSKH